MNEQERELDLMVAELEQENRLLRARNERLEREALAKQPAQDQQPFCYHDGRNIVGKDFAEHSDVFPLYTAPQPSQQDWEAVAADQAMTIALLKAEQPAQRKQVGDSRFESWYSEDFDPKGKGTKQRMREAYEAGMNDPCPRPAQQQEPVAVPTNSYEHRKFVLVGRDWYERFAAFHDDCQIGEQLTWEEKTIRQQGYENGWNDAQRYLREIQPPPPARKPLGFAGVTVWVGDAVATQIVTEVAIQRERIPSQSITMAAQRCVDMLAAHRIKEQP